MTHPNQIERVFERILWKFRLFTLLSVIFGLISSLTFFLLGSLEVIEGIAHKVNEVSGAWDIYLRGTTDG
jgi:uncharacterized membrane protein YqhA